VSYLIPTEEISLAEQYRMRKTAIEMGHSRARELWSMSDANITERDADYVTDFIPAATAAGLAGWLTMPLVAPVGGFVSVFADNVPAAVTPAVPTNQVWVFYKVSQLTLGDPVSMLQFRRGAAANLIAQFDFEAMYGKLVDDGYFSQPVTYENPEIATVQVEVRIAGPAARVRLGCFIIEPLQNTTV
jgi:hypothetical protein